MACRAALQRQRPLQVELCQAQLAYPASAQIPSVDSFIQFLYNFKMLCQAQHQNLRPRVLLIFMTSALRHTTPRGLR
jgi:hypothetical protein